MNKTILKKFSALKSAWLLVSVEAVAVLTSRVSVQLPVFRLVHLP